MVTQKRKFNLIFLFVALLCNLPMGVILSAQRVSFVARRDFKVGRDPRSLTVGDFNGDTIADLAVANASSNNVSILLGNGDGTFGPPRNFMTGDTPVSVVTCDFNGDNKLDLAAINETTDTVSILLGNGDGTFRALQSFPVGSRPIAIAIGDFNEDRIPDLVVTNDGRALDYRSTISVLLGNGDGTFQPARDSAIGRSPVSVTVGDLNRDNHQDLAVTLYGTQNVAILFGQGDGTFQPAQNLAVGFGPRSLSIGDFNRDGKPDLVVANACGTDPRCQRGTVSILLGNGDGTFQTSRHFAVGKLTSFVTIGDYNGDAIADLAVANEYSSDISILLGNGDGTFQAAQNLSVGSHPMSIIVADFNGDSFQDLAVANDYSDTISILLGNGASTFIEARNMAVGGRSGVVADFNGDRILDMAIASCGEDVLCRGPDIVFIRLGNGDGTFRVAPSLEVGSEPSALAVGDFNGDGIPDLAVANFGTGPNLGTVSILFGNGDGTFQRAQNVAVAGNPRALAVGDFNGDGFWDLAVANSGSYPFPGLTVSVLLGNGNGTFQPARNFEVGRVPLSIAVGDFNGDNKQDLAVANWDSFTVSILLGNGDGTFRAAREVAIEGRPESVVVGDFNKDGIKDLAVADSYLDRVAILLGNGDGTFRTPQTFPVGFSPRSLSIGDLNGDDYEDLAVANYASNNVSVLLGSGDGTFQGTQHFFGTGAGPQSIMMGDFNRDNLQDLATVNLYSGTVSILINDIMPPQHFAQFGNGANFVSSLILTNPSRTKTAICRPSGRDRATAGRIDR